MDMIQFRAFSLLAALVDLGKEGLENSFLETIVLIDVSNALTDLADNFLFIVQITLLKIEVIVKLLDDLLLLIVLAAIVFLKNLSLLRGCYGQGLVDEPRALVILDVGADLAYMLRLAEVVKVVILDLKVLPERNEDILSLLEVAGSGEVELVKGEGDGEVE